MELEKPALARRLDLKALVFYGVGDILGAGIYVLVGKVIGICGGMAWLAFLLSGLLAALTGLSYAELAARVPKSAGVAAFCARAFPRPEISFLAGVLILASGLTSSATVSLAVFGYLNQFISVPQLPAALGVIALISWVSYRGIQLSSRANKFCTVLEVSGLLWIVAAGSYYVLSTGIPPANNLLEPDGGAGLVLAGSALAFYAFVGFEDLANLAEEAKNPAKDIPLAMLYAVAISGALYLAVILVMLWVVPRELAGASRTPLLEVLNAAGFPLPPRAFAAIAIVAVLNTGLANLIMASRLLYGMSEEKMLPEILSRVHPKRQTPWAAVLTAMALCSLLVVTGGVKIMAQTTSCLLLLAFILAHASLIALRKREGPNTGFRAPAFVPYLGIAVCILLLAQFGGRQTYAYAAIILAAGLALGLIKRKGPILFQG